MGSAGNGQVVVAAVLFQQGHGIRPQMGCDAKTACCSQSCCLRASAVSLALARPSGFSHSQ